MYGAEPCKTNMDAKIKAIALENNGGLDIGR